MTKSGTYFHFKQFSVKHDKATMKVGTDGVLLGAWANIAGALDILDIGTGSGVIALMLAQRTASDVHIDAVEIEAVDCEQATENILASPWHNRINVYPSAIQNFYPEKQYDLIVSNPPFFINSYEPPDKRRHQTRHTVSLSFPELLAAVKRLLKPNGKFCTILPYTEGLQFIALAAQHNLFCSRQWSFCTRKEKPIERWLLEFCASSQQIEKGEVLLYDNHDTWSESYRSLTKDFYLKL